MKLVYFTLTNNCVRFATKCAETLGLRTPTLLSDDWEGTEDVIVFFPTTGFGKVPRPVIKYLKEHKDRVKMVVSSGNRNWGENFAIGADTVTEKLGIPSEKFELAGNREDLERITNKIKTFMV